MTKSSFLSIVPIKDNDDRASDQLTLLTRTHMNKYGCYGVVIAQVGLEWPKCVTYVIDVLFSETSRWERLS